MLIYCNNLKNCRLTLTWPLPSLSSSSPLHRPPLVGLTEPGFSCVRVCSCWCAAFSSTSPPPTVTEGEKKIPRFQAGVDWQCRREKVRWRRDGWGCEWEGELLKREGSPSLRPAYLLLLPSQPYFSIFFFIFTSTTGVQTFLYSVILPFIPPSSRHILQVRNLFPRDPDSA